MSVVASPAPAVPAVLPNAPVPGLGGPRRLAEAVPPGWGGSGANRLSYDEGLLLFCEATLLEAGAAADAVRRRMHPANRVTYQIDRTANSTTVCIDRGAFCAFYRPAGDAEGYVLPLEEIGRKAEETIALGGPGI